MNGSIFLIQDDKLVEMTEHDYSSEDLLQGFLEKYPSLLAGNQIDRVTPRRWLLISRETSVPCEEGGSERWSLDHLFLDQDGIPTLIEVKRSSDTRLRREVVGQMLDYAANAVLYWPSQVIRNRLECRCEESGLDPEEVLQKFLGDDADYDKFWQSVKINLKAGKVRLMFVADEIPSELQRIVEFLNGQMDPAEVLAVEIKQYVGHDLRTLVPRVIGQIAEPPRPKRQWDKPSFFNDLKSRQGQKDYDIAQKIMEWIISKGMEIRWGKGGTYGTFYPVLRHEGQANGLFGVYSSGRLEVDFRHHPLKAEEQKLELFNRLNAIEGVSLPHKAIDSWSSFALCTLAGDRLTSFFAIFEWVIEEIKAS